VVLTLSPVQNLNDIKMIIVGDIICLLYDVLEEAGVEVPVVEEEAVEKGSGSVEVVLLGLAEVEAVVELVIEVVIKIMIDLNEVVVVGERENAVRIIEETGIEAVGKKKEKRIQKGIAIKIVVKKIEIERVRKIKRGQYPDLKTIRRRNPKLHL
jgi:hypothetical protein